MHKESSVFCQCFVDADAVKVKLLSQVERVNSLQNWGANYDMNDNDDESEESINDNEYYKPLNQVCPKQRYRRTQPVIDYLNEAAKMNKVTLNELLAIILKRS